ncbi:hypothetical protein [Nostoc sp.]|uniref:hypothetical protein n=1 Tax=Nostoc sp. TaxID=1180 RepID=UPI002FFB0E65
MGDDGDEGTSWYMKAAGIAIDEEYYRKVANAKDIYWRTYTSRQREQCDFVR